MKNFILFLLRSTSCALLIGCRDQLEQSPRERYLSVSCDAVTVTEDGNVMAAVNTADYTYIGPAALDFDPNATNNYAAIHTYDGRGHLRSARTFSGHESFGFQAIYGLRPLADGRLLIVGGGCGLMSAVMAPNGQYVDAHLWNRDQVVYYMSSTLTATGIACDYWGTASRRLAQFADNSDRISEIPVPPGYSAMLTGYHDGVVLASGPTVMEYNSYGEIVWSATADSTYFMTGGVDLNGQLTLFGIMDEPRPHHGLAVGIRLGDSLQIQRIVMNEYVPLLYFAVPAPNSSWLLAARPSSYVPDQQKLLLLRYDGADSVSVTDEWTPEGEDPRAVSMASSPDGWCVVSGYLQKPHDVLNQNHTAFLRAYNPSGQPLWCNIFQ